MEILLGSLLDDMLEPFGSFCHQVLVLGVCGRPATGLLQLQPSLLQVMGLWFVVILFAVLRRRYTQIDRVQSTHQLRGVGHAGNLALPINSATGTPALRLKDHLAAPLPQPSEVEPQRPLYCAYITLNRNLEL